MQWYRCQRRDRSGDNLMPSDKSSTKVDAMLAAVNAHARDCAVETGRDAISPRVLNALARTPRHLFVPEEYAASAYEDMPLPIGSGKTISQPFMVALASDLLDLQPDARVLEVGIGFGYQSAVLADLSAQVFAVEIIPELAEEAKVRLRAAGVKNVEIRIGDGARGWPDKAPFDGIVVSSAAKALPKLLVDQLTRGGRMVVPIGDDAAQTLYLIVKESDGKVVTKPLIPVRYSALSTSH